jgi:ribosomal protein L12E/L44/L45/RPP1/RPP2
MLQRAISMKLPYLLKRTSTPNKLTTAAAAAAQADKNKDKKEKEKADDGKKEEDAKDTKVGNKERQQHDKVYHD